MIKIKTKHPMLAAFRRSRHAYRVKFPFTPPGHDARTCESADMALHSTEIGNFAAGPAPDYRGYVAITARLEPGLH